MADGYNSAFNQPPKKKFDLQGLVQGLLQGAANATKATNPWEGALLGGAGAIDYSNQEASRQAQIQNLMEDNLRGNQLLDLQKQRYGQDIKEYEEIDKPYKQGILNLMSEKISPRQQRYNDEMARTKLSQAKNENVILRNKARGFTGADGEFRKPYYTGFKEYLLPNGQVLEERKEASRGTIDYLNKMTGEILNRLPEGAKEKAMVNPPLPASTSTELSDYDTLINFGNEALKLHDASFTGPIQGVYGKVKARVVGVPENQQLFYDYLTNIRDRIYKLLSGGQITSGEASRMLEEVPQANWADESVKNKLNNFIKISSEIVGNRKKGLEPNYRNVPGSPSQVSNNTPVSLPDNIKTYTEAIQYLKTTGMTEEKAMQWIKDND